MGTYSRQRTPPDLTRRTTTIVRTNTGFPLPCDRRTSDEYRRGELIMILRKPKLYRNPDTCNAPQLRTLLSAIIHYPVEVARALYPHRSGNVTAAWFLHTYAYYREKELSALEDNHPWIAEVMANARDEAYTHVPEFARWKEA